MSAPVISATEPGGLKEYKTRELPDGGLIEFEVAPAGYITKTGTVRKAPWRAYYHTPKGGKRKRMTSVTTLLGPILDKPGLPPWAEKKGIEGVMEALRLNLITPETPPAQVVDAIRTHRLGAEAARDDAADRGINVHALLEEYARTGKAPSLSKHPKEHRGYIRALAGWLLHAKPEPTSIEELVCDPEAGYAGRMDLIADIGGFSTAVDFKTSDKAGIYEGAHAQLRLYVRAHVACGGEEPIFGRVVVFAGNGEFREMDCLADDDLTDKALAYARKLQPIRSTCEAANRLEREARKAVAV